MRIGSDQTTQASRVDPRVTYFGAFLRKTSIDEFPQLFNVVLGDMLLVGPRPHPIWFKDKYTPYFPYYMERHLVKPGITGLAQISGARGETELLRKMKRRLIYDNFYIKKRSVKIDLYILLLTPFRLFCETAY